MRSTSLAMKCYRLMLRESNRVPLALQAPAVDHNYILRLINGLTCSLTASEEIDNHSQIDDITLRLRMSLNWARL